MVSKQKLLPLSLQVGTDQLQLFVKRSKDERFSRFQQRVLSRDNHTCRYCGFAAKSGFMAINVDGNYRNNKLANMATACPLCAQCHFLDGIGLPMFPGGVLVFTPEISQTEMNSMTHILFQSIFAEDDNASQSKNIYRTMRLRSQLVEKQLGEDLSNPSTYARMLIDADPKQAKQFNEKVSQSVRLLPDMIGFQPLVRSWQAAAFAELSSGTMTG